MPDCAKCGLPMDPLAPQDCEVSGLCAPPNAECAGMGCSPYTPCSPECEALLSTSK